MSVTTNYATTLSEDLITLNATLDDLHGESSLDVSFEYGTSISYGSVTAPEMLTSTGAFSATLLASSLDDFYSTTTIYFFRATATDGVTTWHGANRFFVNLNAAGSDPYIIDADMDSGTLTNTEVFRDVLLLSYSFGAIESPEFKGTEITSGSIIPLIYESPEFKGAEITGGTIV